MRAVLIAVLFFLLCAVPSRGQRGDWYNDEGGFTFEGAGTRLDPYRVSSVTALSYLAEQVNMWPGKSFQGEYFVLTEDLDLGRHFWIPIGSEAHQPFRGVFNGNGKVIHNLYIGSTEVDNVYAAAGLFGYLGNGARIENLTIDGGVIVGGGREAVSRTGCLAAYLLCSVSGGRDSIVVRNCHIQCMTVLGADTEVSHTGGLIGEAYAFSEGEGEALVLIDYCSSSSVVSAPASAFPYTGGIVGKGRGHGYCDGAGRASGVFVIRSCLNSGGIRGGDAAGKEAVSSTGGILGFGYASGDGYGQGGGTGAFVIEYCLNSGAVTGGDAVGHQAFSYTGGLLGYGDGSGYGDRPGGFVTASGYGAGTFLVQYSANRGAVGGGDAPGESAATSTGGIAGFASGSATGYGGGGGAGRGLFRMRSCYSYASIASRSGFLGGLAGSLATVGNGENHTVSALISDCYAAGAINRGDTVFPDVTGGIAGRMQKSKEAVRPPQVVHCLAALSFLNGNGNHTFRIAGLIQGVRPPFSGMMGRNYAGVREGQWTQAKTVKNGREWDGSVFSLPVSEWNVKGKVWHPVSGGALPRLANLLWQEDVPLP
ncbi:MAG: hypothetical protein LBP25_05675 [Tannerellaceae bacterium]|nr:hypothetical protein [Tannerellaceae bacterium]